MRLVSRLRSGDTRLAFRDFRVALIRWTNECLELAQSDCSRSGRVTANPYVQ